MNFLFVHQNFPGQLLHIVRFLHGSGQHTIRFVTQRRDKEIEGVETLQYIPLPVSTGIQPYLIDIEANTMNGLAVARLCEGLKRDGFTPDIVVGHSGWGELIFIKDVWPNVPLLSYFEFFYRLSGSDVDFDAEFPNRPDDAPRLRMRNSTNLLTLNAADWGYTPTKWQHAQYPEIYRDRITVIHEGVDTDHVRPNATAQISMRGGLWLSRADQVITYSVRNLEPYRGFHVLMRTLPEIQKRHPKAHVILLGGDAISYGRPPPQGCWREHMLAEVGSSLDMSRIHFVGWLPYEQYLAVLNISSVHIYLTYPFVLSWGLIEAMASECCIVASRTPPVEEVMEDGETGLLFDFFDRAGLADRVSEALEHPQQMIPMRQRARQHAVAQFDLNTVTLPRQLALIGRFVGKDLMAPARPPKRTARPKRSTARQPALAAAR